MNGDGVIMPGGPETRVAYLSLRAPTLFARYSRGARANPDRTLLSVNCDNPFNMFGLVERDQATIPTTSVVTPARSMAARYPPRPGSISNYAPVRASSA
ncbi:MAG TPA: hypothetical protein VF463_12515 [Sphingobium sp.]